MKPVIIIAIAFVLLIVPLISISHAFQFSNEEDPFASSYRGNDGSSINSACDRKTFHVDLTLQSEFPTPIKFEFLNPDGKVVGVYEETMRGSLSTDIDVNYDIEGLYQILLYYKGEIFEVQKIGFDEDEIPSRDDQLQCLMAKTINAGTYHEVGRLDTSNINYETIWEENKYELEKILGKELFEHYEPIVSIDAIYDSPTSTSLAFKELDKLPAILNNYSYEKNLLNHEIQINLIKKMDSLSDEEKVDLIYDRQVNWDAIVSHYEYTNQNFVDKIKELYLYLDETDEIYAQALDAYKKEQEALLKIQQELELEELEAKQKIREELANEENKNISENICGTGTIEKDGICVPDYPDTSPSSKGGGCLIATATYGSELAPQVQQLRELRDNSLLQTESGTSFMGTFNDFYYSFSPIIADYERENLVFKEMVKIVITPMITSLSILNYVDMDSEVEVLGYGVSLIILNIGMYVGIPAIVIMRIRK